MTASDAHRPPNPRLAWDPAEVLVSQCASCRHKAAGAAACKAFPSQIPEAILANRFDHRRPFEGDQGVRYEPVAGFGPPADFTA